MRPRPSFLYRAKWFPWYRFLVRILPMALLIRRIMTTTRMINDDDVFKRSVTPLTCQHYSINVNNMCNYNALEIQTLIPEVYCSCVLSRPTCVMALTLVPITRLQLPSVCPSSIPLPFSRSISGRRHQHFQILTSRKNFNFKLASLNSPLTSPF
jgi:hypothetical protein